MNKKLKSTFKKSVSFLVSFLLILYPYYPLLQINRPAFADENIPTSENSLSASTSAEPSTEPAPEPAPVVTKTQNVDIVNNSGDPIDNAVLSEEATPSASTPVPEMVAAAQPSGTENPSQPIDQPNTNAQEPSQTNPANPEPKVLGTQISNNEIETPSLKVVESKNNQKTENNSLLGNVVNGLLSFVGLLNTDKSDYAPTDTATITGSGFKANESYTLIISSNDEPVVHFETSVTTDATGTFVYAYQLDGNYRPNYKVELKDSSGRTVATITFTDASPTISVTLSGTGTGTVTSSDSFINCPTTCSHTYGANVSTILTATAAGGSTFTGWSGAGGCTGTGTCSAIQNGNDTFAATATFNLSDTTAPTTTDSGIDTNWHNANVTVTLTCTDNAGGSGCANTYHTTDGTTPTTGSSTTNPFTLTTDGNYTIKYFSKDIAGNSETVKTAINTVKIDKTNPVDPTVTSPSHIVSTWSNDNTVDMSWSGATDSLSGVAGYSYLFDTSPATAPDHISEGAGTSTTSSPLADGSSWYFHLATVDNAGNWTSTVHKGPFFIDTIAPSVSADGASASWRISNIIITLSASDSGGSSLKTAKYNWDSPATASIGTNFTNGNTISIPSDGNHTLYLYADDNAGNSNTFSGTYRLDTVAPTTTDSGIDTNWHNTDVTVTLSCSDSASGCASTYHTTDGTTPTTGSSTTNPFTLTTDGTYTIKYFSKDNAGNSESIKTVANTVKVDKTKPIDPTVSSSSHSTSAWSNDNTVDVSWSGASDATSGVAGYSYLWDTSSATLPDTISEGSGLSNTSPAITDGNSNYFHLRTVDNAGNWTSTVHLGPFYIDTASPTAPGTPSTTTPTNSISQTWNWSAATDALSGIFNYLWRTDAPSSGSVLGTSATTGLTEGLWNFFVKAQDNAGNFSSESTAPVLVDTTAPVTTDSGIDTSWHNTDITVTLTCADSVGGSGCTNIYHTTDGTTPTVGSSTTNPFTLTPDGTYTIKYFSKDNAGNSESVKTAANTVKIDKTNPTKPTASPAGGDYISEQSVLLSSTDSPSGVDSIYYTTDGSDPSKSSSFFSPGLPVKVSKSLTLKAIAFDKAGNKSDILTESYGIAPTISAEGSVLPSATSATVTWSTDNLATSRVIYDTTSHGSLGSAPNYGYANSTGESDTSPKVTSHSVTVTGLTAATTYYYRGVSRGSPETVGAEKSFTLGAGVVAGVATGPTTSNFGVGEILGSEKTTTEKGSDQNKILGEQISATPVAQTVKENSTQKTQSSNNYWWILLLLIGGGGLFYFIRDRKK